MKDHPKQQPVWAEPFEQAGGLPERTKFDVCVIGAGIAGLSAAYHLCRAGAQVIVLDDGPVAGGQTACTTAHLASALDDRFGSLERGRGKEVARVAAASHAAAIDAIQAAVEREGIDCGFARVDGYLIPHEDKAADTVRSELDASRRAGLDTELIAAAPGIQAAGPALRFPRQGQFEPVKYLAGLARAVAAAGGTIVTGVHVTAVADGSPVKVTAKGGAEVYAGAAVVATNSPVIDRLALQTVLYPYLTYVVALRVPAGSVPKALWWDTEDPYHYARTTAGPGGDDLLIVGGEDHRTGMATDHEDRFARLEWWARGHFPGAGAVTHRWAGQVLETPDGLAFLGPNPGHRHVYVATGDSGMGMTHGTIAGLLLTDLIQGRANAWADAYSPGRVPVGGLSTYVSENASTAASYGAWLTPGEVGSIDEVRPGQGAVVRQGLTKLAVYRDDAGEAHVCSAVCPHLGAVVAWNAAEKTWDCPAHGSRFDCKGGVVQGPANADLEPHGAAVAGK